MKTKNVKDQRIKNALQIFTAINLPANDFDPDQKLTLEKLPSYKVFRDVIGQVTLDEISKPKLKKILEDILINDAFNFVNSETLISSDYMLTILKNISQYLHTHFATQAPKFKQEKWNQLEALVLQMMALRLHKQVIYEKIPFPSEKIDETMRKNDFNALKDEVKKLAAHSTLETTSFPTPRVGAIVSNAYTQEQRLSVAKKGDKSPLALWTDPANVSQFFQEFRIVIAQRIKTAKVAHEEIFKSDLSKLNGHITADRFRSQVTFRTGANQFQPILVAQLIVLLNKHHHPDNPSIRYIERYCDPCAGWGDRLVGAFAAAETLGLKSYVGTAPNTRLKSAYQQLIKDHKPEGFEAIIYDKPIEECTPKELMPGGKKNQLLMTCPPYFSLEIYEGEKQSTKQYPQYEQWKEKFLYELVHLSMQVLEVGGYVSYIVGADKKNNIPVDLDGYMKSCKYLNVLYCLDSGQKGTTKTIVAQFIGEQPTIEKKLLAPVIEPITKKPTGEKEEFERISDPRRQKVFRTEQHCFFTKNQEKVSSPGKNEDKNEKVLTIYQNP